MVSRPHVPIALMVVTTMLLLTVVPTPLSLAAKKEKDTGPPEENFSLTLAWDANTEKDLKGYKVYMAPVWGEYKPIAILNKRKTTYQVEELQKNTTYFFVVSAFDTSGNESFSSNEVSTTIY